MKLGCTLFIVPLLLAGCGSMKVPDVNLWPFGEEKAEERPRGPANATEYQCGGNRKFHVRMIENGDAAWVILPEREFRLDKAGAESGTRYARGAITLDLQGNEATLTDSAGVSYSNCKAPGEAKK